MDKKAITGFIEQSGFAEIPLLQQKFNLSYKEAKSFVDGLIESRILKYDNGVRYSYVGAKDNNCGKKDVFDAETCKAPDKFVSRLLVEQCKKICERIRSEAYNGADEDVIKWLSAKLEQNGDFDLYDALVKAEDELLLAKCECSDYEIEACTRVWEFFKACSESEFEKLKKRLTA